MLHDEFMPPMMACDSLPKGTILLLNPAYKTAPVNQGEPPMLQQVLDIEKTAKKSILFRNV